MRLVSDHLFSNDASSDNRRPDLLISILFGGSGRIISDVALSDNCDAIMIILTIC